MSIEISRRTASKFRADADALRRIAFGIDGLSKGAGIESRATIYYEIIRPLQVAADTLSEIANQEI